MITKVLLAIINLETIYILILNLKSTEIHMLNVNLISGKEFQANTICLPFDEKPNEKYLGDYVTVAGWGYTKNGKLVRWCIKIMYWRI